MSDRFGLSANQNDCLQEVVNVAMGQAGDSLARLLGVFVTLSVPRISILAPSDIHHTIGGESVVATRQAFQDGSGKAGCLRGEAITVFGDSSFGELAELLDYDDGETGDHAETELLLDVSNVLNGACLTGIADQLGEELIYSAPSVLGRGPHIDDWLVKERLQWESVLSVEIVYRLENRSFRCALLLLMPDSAISHLTAKLDQLLDAL